MHILIEQQNAIGNQWEKIARNMPGRSGNSLKNAYRACIKQQNKQVKQPKEKQITKKGTLKRKRVNSDMEPIYVEREFVDFSDLDQNREKRSSKKRRVNSNKKPIYVDTTWASFSDEKELAKFIAHLDKRFEDEDMANLQQSLASGNILTEAEMQQAWPDSVFSDF